MPAMNCILCGGGNSSILYKEDRPSRAYFRCAVCRLSFLNPADQLNVDEEGRRYSSHENHPDNPGYRKFLSPIVERIEQFGSPQVLDFGCGAGAPIRHWLKPLGFDVQVYDPFFFPDKEPLERVYDYVAATEVIEHLHNPAKEFARLRALVRDGGKLGVMTEFCDLGADFGNWYYRRDPTHVAFYARETLEWIRKNFAFKEVRILGSRLAEFLG